MLFRSLPSLVSLGLVTLACSSPSPLPPPEDSSVLARFRGGEVSIAELDAYLERNAATDVAAGPASEGSGEDAAEADPRRRALTEIAVDKALAAEAAAWEEPSRVARVEAAIGKASDAILLEEMRERRGWNEPELSAEELRAWFDAHPELYASPRQARLQHIFLRAETGVLADAEREEIRRRLEAIRREAVTGADFAALVRKHSESATAAGGGFLTLDATTPVPQAFSAAVWGLEVNEISEVVDAGNGFHLIKLKQTFEPSRRSFEESLDHVRRKAGQAKVEALQQELIREVGPRYELERHYERLGSDPDSGQPVVLISWRGGAYTLGELLLEVHEAFQEQLFQGYLGDVERVLDQVAAHRLLILEAQAEKVAQEEGVERRIAEVADDLRAQAGLELRLEGLVAAVPESELRDYFAQNEERYQTLRTYDLTVIHLARRRGESFWQALKRGEDLVARIRGGEDMEELAREHSRHYTAAAGGRLQYFTDAGVRTRIQATAKFRRRLEALSAGEVSDAFLSECYDPARLEYVQTGVYIVRLDALHEPVQQNFEDMVDAVRQNYLRRHYRRLVEEVRRDVADEIGLEIFADRLPAI